MTTTTLLLHYYYYYYYYYNNNNNVTNITTLQYCIIHCIKLLQLVFVYQYMDTQKKMFENCTSRMFHKLEALPVIKPTAATEWSGRQQPFSCSICLLLPLHYNIQRNHRATGNMHCVRTSTRELTTVSGHKMPPCCLCVMDSPAPRTSLCCHRTLGHGTYWKSNSFHCTQPAKVEAWKRTGYLVL